MTLIADNIHKTYERNENSISVISDVNIAIGIGEYHCIFGSSGSGKSTLLNVLSGMLAPSTGTVYFEEESLYSKKESERTKLRINSIGYIMQGTSLLGNLSVYDNIVFPVEMAKQKVNYEEVDQIIEKLDLGKLIEAYPKELSGGEYRRVSIARTIACNPKIIIADEPTSNLDENSAQIIRDIFEDLYLSGTGIVVATHDTKFITKEHLIHHIECGKLN